MVRGPCAENFLTALLHCELKGLNDHSSENTSRSPIDHPKSQDYSSMIALAMPVLKVMNQCPVEPCMCLGGQLPSWNRGNWLRWR